jgi:SAM-dependent methyltransferase
MTTPSPDPAPAPVARPDGQPPVAVHQQRQVAESFGDEAGRYDRARPGYPAALVDRVVAASPGPDILDVGCGTGISARLFRAHGCRVLGVEPDPRMAELARRSGVEVEQAKFEEWDAAGRRFDTVIAAQAWHWVDPVAGAVRAASVLRPGGRLTVFWNVFDPPAQLRAAFADVYRRVLPDSPLGGFLSRPALTAYDQMCGTAVDGIRQAASFGEPERWRFDWSRPYTRHEWLDTARTLGGHSQLPAGVLTELLAGLGAAVDAAGGIFTMSYATVAVAAVANSADPQQRASGHPG